MGEEATAVSEFATETAAATGQSVPGDGQSASASSASAAPAALGTPSGGGPVDQTQTPAAQPNVVELLQKMLAEESGEAPQTPAEDPLKKLMEGIDPTTPAGQRIQQLANLRREAVEQNAAYQQQLTQAQTYVQQVQQWAQNQAAQAQAQVQQMQMQMQALTAQMQALAAGRAKEPEDPGERMRNQWLEGMRGEVQKALTPLQQENQQLRQQFQNYVQTQQRQVLTSQYKSEAMQAAEQVVLKGIPPELAGQMRSNIVPQILAIQMNTGMTAAEAAGMVRQTLLRAALGFAQMSSNPLKESLARAGAEVPTATPTRRVNGEGAGMPSIEQIKKMGYRDELEYLQRNS